MTTLAPTFTGTNTRVRRVPITVEMYHSLDRSGAFGPEERLELIDGDIYEMSPIGSRHSRIVKILMKMLVRQFSDEFIVSVQDPIELDDRSEPQPDLCILRLTEDYYHDALPKASDVHLIIEVADSSAGFDRETKAPRYAAAGIPEMWLIDLESGHVEVHTLPKESAYGLVKIYLRGENAVSDTFENLSVSVDELLG